MGQTEVIGSRRTSRASPCPVAPTTYSAASASHYAYQPALDGLRAFAVGGVMLYHASQPWALGGYLGVDAFFVLSGFLITTLLVTEWGANGRIDLAGFWARRARRLLPALALVMFGVVAYAALFAGSGELARIRADGLATLGYVANWRFVFSGQSYFDQFTQPSPFRHMWSLAIEEQFYLVWPLVVFGVLTLTRSVRALLVVSTVLMVGSATLMAILHSPGTDPSRVYYGTDTRAQSLLMGAIAALLVHNHGAVRKLLWRGLLRVLALAGAGYTIWLWSNMSERSDALYRGGFLLAAFAVVLVIVSVTQPDPGLLGRALSWYPLRWVGMISYGLYLWHWPVYLTITRSRTGLEGTTLLLVRVAVTFAFATASYYLVERPIRRGTLRVPRPAVVAPAVAAAIVVALVVSTSGVETPAQIARRSTTARPSELDAGTAAEVQRPMSEGTAAGDGAVSAEPVRPVTALLLGDSVAVSLGVGLERVAAEGTGLMVVNRSTLGCGMLRRGEVEIGRELNLQGENCNDWNGRWLTYVDEFRPDVVVLLTGAWDLLDRKIDNVWYSPGDVGFDRYFLSELDQATQLLASRGARVVLLTTPFFNRPELVGQTGREWPEYEPWRVDRINALFRDFLVAHPARYTLIDLNRFVSPHGRFTDTLDGVHLRPDGVHFTLEGAVYVSRWLAPQLERVGRAPVVTTEKLERYDPRRLRAF